MLCLKGHVKRYAAKDKIGPVEIDADCFIHCQSIDGSASTVIFSYKIIFFPLYIMCLLPCRKKV